MSESVYLVCLLTDTLDIAAILVAFKNEEVATAYIRENKLENACIKRVDVR